MATYKCDDGNAEVEITASSARAAAQAYVDGGDWGDDSETSWVTVYVTPFRWRVLDADGDEVAAHDDEADAEADADARADAAKADADYDGAERGGYSVEYGEADDHGTRDSYKIAIELTEPDCDHADGHDWQAPQSIVGGIESNPGVYGHGGGVIMQEVCMRCGCGRVTDTWAQDRATGEQGLRSVEYQRGKYASEVDTANTLGSD